MWAFGVQEWFRRAVGRLRHRPRGSRVGVVRVCVLMRIRAIMLWTKAGDSLVPEYVVAAWLINSMVCHVVKPSLFLVCLA